MCGRISCASTRQRDRADMAAGLGALDHQRIGAGAHQPLRQHQRRGEARSASRRRPSPRAPRRPAGCRRPARYGRPCASRQTRIRSSSCGCMVIRFTPNGLSVSAWVPAISAASRSGSIEPQAITPKPPALEIADDQVALADPAHRAAHDGDARSRGTRVPRAHSRSSSARAAASRRRSGDVRRHRGRRRCAARAPRARCIRRRSAR